MKPNKLLVSMLIVFSIAFVLNQKSYPQDKFEGKVTFNVYDGGEGHTMEYFVKGSKMRFDVNEKGQMGQIIMDPAAKQFMMIMPQQKMYMVMQIPDNKMNSENSEGSKDNTKFVKTGETKKILGYTAEKWTYNDGDNQGEAWMTNEVGALMMFDNPMQKEKPQWMKDIEDAGYFPLEVYENGNKVYEVTDIEKKTLDNSMFEPPAGYQKMDMPMMQK